MASLYHNLADRGQAQSNYLPTRKGLENYHLPLQIASSHQNLQHNKSNQGCGDSFMSQKQGTLPSAGGNPSLQTMDRISHTLDAQADYRSPHYNTNQGGNRASSHMDNTSQGGSRRRLSHSPVSINPAYELCPQNTEKLWKEFSSNLNKSMSRGSMNERKQSAANQYYSSQAQLQSREPWKPQPVPLASFNQPRDSFDAGHVPSPQRSLKTSKGIQSSFNLVESRTRMNRHQQNKENPSFGDDMLAKSGYSDHLGSMNLTSGGNQGTYQETKPQFYRTTGLNQQIPTDESKNRLMLGSRLREIFQASNENLNQSQTVQANPSLRESGSNFYVNSKPLRHQDLASSGRQTSFSPASRGHYGKIRDSNQFSSTKKKDITQPIDSSQRVRLLDSRETSINHINKIYQKYMDINSQDHVSESKLTYNQTITSGEDFKTKVQQKIIEMQNDLKNPSPIRSPNTSHGNLDSYMRAQNHTCFNLQSSQGARAAHNGLSSIDSLKNNYGDKGSNTIDLTTARFINNHGGLMRLAAHQQHLSQGGPVLVNLKNEIYQDNAFGDSQMSRKVSIDHSRSRIAQGEPMKSPSYYHNSSRFRNSSTKNRGAENLNSRRTLSSGKRSNVMSEERRLSITSGQSRGHFNEIARITTKGGSSIRFEDEVLSQNQDQVNFRDQMDKKGSIDRSISNGAQVKTLRSSKSSSLFNKYTKQVSSRSRVHISDRPYFSKDWSYLRSCEESRDYCQVKSKPDTIPALEEMHSLIASHYYKPILHNGYQTEPFRSIKSPRGKSNGKNNTHYDMIIDENDHLLLNSYAANELPRDYKKVSSKYWNAKERIKNIQDEVQSMIDQVTTFKEIKADSLTPQDAMTKLLIAEKLLRLYQSKQSGDLSDFLLLRFYNVYLQLTLYKLQGDFRKILKLVTSNTAGNIHLMNSLNHISHKSRVRRDLSFYVLHILCLKAGAQYKHDSIERAQATYSQIVHLYERWRTNKYQDEKVSEMHMKNLFGTEEYIQARAMSAECMQAMGKLHDTIDQYESIKKEMENLIVFEDSVLYINVCNQLGNCYFKLNEVDKALENLQLSLLSIHKVRGKPSSLTLSPIDDLMIAKICRNIAIIAELKGYINDAIKMNEQCLVFKLKQLPNFHDEVLISQLQCAQAYEAAGDFQLASQYYEKAYLTCKGLNGDNDYQTIQILTKFTTLRHAVLETQGYGSAQKV